MQLSWITKIFTFAKDEELIFMRWFLHSF